MKKTALLIALGFIFFSVKAQDIIWLKSGKKIEGSIVSFANKTVSIKIGNETTVYKLDEVKSLTYSGSDGKSKEATSSPVKTETRKDDINEAPVKTVK